MFFACDPTTDETIALKERYRLERKSIKKLYKNSDLFDLMLLKLLGYNNHSKPLKNSRNTSSEGTVFIKNAAIN
jgi:uncharacterized membrane protein